MTGKEVSFENQQPSSRQDRAWHSGTVAVNVHTYIQLKFDNSHLQNNVQQCITIKTTDMVGNGNTRKDNMRTVSQHSMPDYKNGL